MSLIRRMLVVAVMAVVPVFASTASSATLELDTVWVDDPTQLESCGLNDYSPTGCYGWWEHYVVYTAGAERNNVTLGGEGTEAIVLRDPNVPIAAGGEDDNVVGDPTSYPYYLENWEVPIGRSWRCLSPQGRGNGLCVGTSSDDGIASFDRLTIVLDGGDDKLTLMRGSMPAHVFAGSGNDTIDSRNNTVDQIDCGDGADAVATDGLDAIATSCENVTRGLGLPKP
jgi:Ca2+-binding RTX toxin-like protein